MLAGYNYRLGYVRDQYGVFRCLLELGYKEEARKILNFYWNTWKRYGRIHNAQCMGVPGIFHVHENDEVVKSKRDSSFLTLVKKNGIKKYFYHY